MRYTGLTKVGKKAFCINFSLLQTLKITTKEAILLQQIEFVNKKRDYLVLPMTILAAITKISRGHLYKCLKKLQSLELIAISDDGICVTEHYKNIKNADFLQNHADIVGNVQNVACGKNTLTKKKQNITKTQNTRLYQKSKNILDLSLDDTDIQSKQTISTKNVALQGNKEESQRIAMTNTQSNTKDQKNHIENLKTNTSNSEPKPQKSNTFFMTNMSQNATKVSQNITRVHYINKDYSTSLCDNSHKEYIYMFQAKQQKGQSLRIAYPFC